MRRFFSTGSARSAKPAEGSAGGATAKKIGWLCRALPGSPYFPGLTVGDFFSPSGRKRRFRTSLVALRNVSLQVSYGVFTFLLRRCRKGRCKAQRLPEAPHPPQTACKGDDHAEIETPFLRFRGRRRIGFRYASDRVPPLAAPSASSGRRSSRSFGRSRETRSRSGRTSRSGLRRTSGARFRRPSRSPLRILQL